MSVGTLSAWISREEALSALLVSPRTLARLADEGRIGVFEVPGVNKRKYDRADVERLVAEGTRPARANREMIEV